MMTPPVVDAHVTQHVTDRTEIKSVLGPPALTDYNYPMPPCPRGHDFFLAVPVAAPVVDFSYSYSYAYDPYDDVDDDSTDVGECVFIFYFILFFVVSASSTYHMSVDLLGIAAPDLGRNKEILFPRRTPNLPPSMASLISPLQWTQILHVAPF